MKAALIFPGKIAGNSTGGAYTVEGCENILNRIGVEAVIFSLDSKEEKITKENYKEHVFKKLNLNGNFALKGAEFLTNSVFGFSAPAYFLNHNSKMNAAIRNFNPDILIVSVDFIDLAIAYRKSKRDTKILCLTDDYRNIENTRNALFQRFGISSKDGSVKAKMLKGLIESYILSFERKYTKLISNSDRVVVYTPKSKANLSYHYPEFANKISVIPPPLDKIFNKAKTRRAANRILFSGSCGWAPNDKAIKYIKDDIATKLPTFTFLLEGQNCDKYEQKNVISMGFVKDRDGLRDSVDICIAPVVNNAGGLLIKVQKYLAAGKPVIATATALEGFPAQNMHNVIIEDDIKKYPQKIRMLANDYALRRKISLNALGSCKMFSYGVLCRSWKDLIDNL